MCGSGALSPPTLILHFYPQRLQLGGCESGCFQLHVCQNQRVVPTLAALITVNEFRELFRFLSVVLLLFSEPGSRKN